jgi:pimeloyl-ACP methyl ester carboxylesterase
MSSRAKETHRASSAVSADGTAIGYFSLGTGPGLIIVGGVLSSGADYLPLAWLLAEDLEVHVIDRRGRPNSGPQRQDQSRSLLMGGTKSPTVIGQQLATELAEVIPDATLAILPGLGHLAPQHQPSQIATAILANRVAD